MGCTLARGRVTVLGLVVLGLAAAGCGGRSKQDFIPAAERARDAVVSAMEAWKRGDEPGRIEGTPAVNVGDTLRRKGQKLESYEILGEEASDEGRRFAVRVKLVSPAAEEKVSFVVVGIDPIWVFRLEDYNMVTHWEHRMPPAEEPKEQAAK